MLNPTFYSQRIRAQRLKVVQQPGVSQRLAQGLDHHLRR